MKNHHFLSLRLYGLFLVFIGISHFNAQGNNEPAQNTCTPPFALFIPNFDCDNNNYMLGVAVLSLGDADSLALVLNGDTLASFIEEGLQEVGPFNFPSTLSFTLVNNQDTTCNITKTLTFENCPPPNNLCFSQETIPEIPIDGNCATINGTLINATDSGLFFPPSCDLPDQERFDVFYTFTATATNLTFEQIGGTGTPVNMLILDACFEGEEVEGTCRGLSNKAVITTLEIDTEYTLMIWQSTATAELELGNFEICIRKTPPPPNDVCANAIPIMPKLGNAGCISDTLFFKTDGTTDSGTNTSCEGGNTGLDQFFTWTATKTGLVWRSLSPGFPGIAIYENTGTTENPQCGNELACSSNLTRQDVELNGWSVGNQLIIQIFDEIQIFEGVAILSDVAFCLREGIDCTPPTAEFIPIFDCNNNNYTLEVRVSNLGDADSLAIVQNGDTLASDVKLGTTIVGPFNFPSTLSFTLAHNNDTICNVTETLTFENCPPPNDHCVLATTIPDIPTNGINCATFSGTLEHATNFGIAPSCDIPGFDRFEVFYTFTATASNLTFQKTDGTTNPLNMLILESCNGATVNGSCSNFVNPVRVTNLTVGVDYILMIWGSKSSTQLNLGTFDICIRKTPEPPANDDCVDAIAFPTIPTDGACASVTGSMEGASGSGARVSCLSGTTRPDIFYTFTATTSNIQLEEKLGGLDVSSFRMAIFDICDGTEIPGSCSTFPNTITGLTVGTTYVLELSTFSQNTAGPFEICIKAAFDLPPNDDCSTAIPIQIPEDGSCATISGTTLNASATGAETECRNARVRDLFYTFEANENTLRFEATLGETLQLEIYEANGNCDLLLVNSCGNFPKTIPDFEIGKSYTLRIWNIFAEDRGPFEFCVKKVNRPPNDNCVDALVFPPIPTDGTSATITGSTEFTFPTNANADCRGAREALDLFYAFEATATEILFEEVRGTADPLFMTVLDFCGEEEVTGSCGEFPKIVSGLDSGRTYILRVWTEFLETQGSFNINAKTLLPPVNDECADAIPLPVNPRFGCQIRTASTNVSATASPQTDDATGTPNNDVWYNFVATNDEHVVVLLDIKTKIGDSQDMAIAVYEGTDGCDNLVFEADANSTFLFLSELTIDNTYFVRVYGFDEENSAQVDYDICIDTPICGVNIFEVVSQECASPNYDVTVYFNYRFTDDGDETPNEFQIFVDDKLVVTVEEPNNSFTQQATFPILADGQSHIIKVVSSTDPDCAAITDYISHPAPCPNIIQMPVDSHVTTTVCEGIFVDPGGRALKC